MSATAPRIAPTPATLLPLTLRCVTLICRCGGTLRWGHDGYITGVLVPDFYAVEPYVCTHCRRLSGQLDFDALNAAANAYRAEGKWPAWCDLRGDTLTIDLAHYHRATPDFSHIVGTPPAAHEPAAVELVSDERGNTYGYANEQDEEA